MADVIETIIARRKSLGISQATLAKKAGMQQSAVARIESKSISPRIVTVEALLNALGLEISAKEAGSD